MKLNDRLMIVMIAPWAIACFLGGLIVLGVMLLAILRFLAGVL